MANKNIGRARLMQQQKNLLKQNLDYLHAAPLETDLYTWHFTFRGPQGTDFHEGLYHGQILLPFQYPFKPPDIVFLNKNGRFQVNTKICLTITQYHTQQWNSAWTVRTMLQAVISLFNERVMGHGYVEASSQVRKFFAKSSQEFQCQKCGLIKNIIKPRAPMQKLEEVSKKKQQQNDSEQKLLYKELEFKKEKIEPKRYHDQQKKPKKKYVKKQKKNQYIDGDVFFLQALKIGSEQFTQVMKTKKYITK